jgi:hypothetical protein
VVLALMAGVGCAPKTQDLSAAEKARFTRLDLSEASLKHVALQMDPAMRSLALRHDPQGRKADLWDRPEGWASLDVSRAPDLGLAEPDLHGEDAAAVNDLRPFSRLPIRPMRPFVMPVGGEDRTRALQCLTQAVYYEAAREGEKGQAAVAQVVLNRVRHPAYPKSICGVVYQGAARSTGCQFTFTCDGSLRWAPVAAYWAQSKRVAEKALAGYVDKQVGSATHYHAQYVAPYWAPTLVKMTQVGQHIFYRWTGPWGEPPAFTGRYAGGEAYLSKAILGGIDQRTQGGLFSPELQGIPPERNVTIAVAGEVRTYKVADASAADGFRTRVMGAIYPTRRQPTADEVKKINESLAALEQKMDAAPAPAAAGVGASSSAKAPAGQ